MSLEVKNDSVGNVTNVVALSPVVQVEAKAKFALAKQSSPRSYAVIPGGGAVTFQWQGRLGSTGAVGISASASAIGPNGRAIETPQVDCGTIAAPEPPSPEKPPTGASEATQCGDCHSSPHMAFVANKWRESRHALRNVTCSKCHPPEAQRAKWKSPIAIYDGTRKSYESVPLSEANDLCTHCHTGEHAQEFQGYGLVMFYAGVRCIDCHMAKIPADDPSIGRWAAHDFKVAANLPYSCGTYPGGCHARRPQSWAERILAAGGIHPPEPSH